MTDFPIAMTKRWKSKTGEDRSETTWMKIVCWGRLAESISQIVEKGDLVYVEGEISVRKYEKDGQQFTVTEIEANNVLKMESARRNTETDETEEN